MKTENEVRMQFIGRSVNEGFARMAVSGFFSQLDPTLEELNDIKMAVSEAVTNAIVHAYPDRIGQVRMVMRVLPGSVAWVKVSDQGCGIPDVETAMQPMFTTAPDQERAGLGFAVMQSFMDKVKVTSRVGRGTSVVMTKRLNPRSRV